MDVGFIAGGFIAGGMFHNANNPLSKDTTDASGEFYRVAVDQKLVTEEELLEACVAAVNEKTETAVRAWVNSQPAPANQ